MALKLDILSGGLRGRSFTFEQPEVLLGRQPSCDVAFDPHLDDSVGRSHACLRVGEGGGWSVENVHENGTLLNGQLVAGVRPLSSGDTLRLAADGPEIRVTIGGVHPGLPAEKRAPAMRAAAPPAPLAPPRPAARELVGFENTWPWAWIFLTAGGLCLAFGLLIVLRFHARRPDQAGAVQPNAEQVGAVAPEPNPPDPIPVSEAHPAAASGPKGQDLWADTLGTVKAGVVLLVVEEPKGKATWPLGSACAIRADTLLTSGAVATELARFRKEGWKTRALFPRDQTKNDIKQIQVHLGYVKSASKPEDQVYFDLGLLEVDRPLPRVCRLANDSELAKLEAGLPLGCVGVAHDAEPLNRFNPTDPELIQGKVLLITTLPPAGGPRLLHLSASIPPNMEGSPIFNQRGEVVGVYSAAAATPNGRTNAPARMHFAPVVDLVFAWLQGEGQDQWVAPAVEKKAPPATGKSP